MSAEAEVEKVFQKIQKDSKERVDHALAFERQDTLTLVRRLLVGLRESHGVVVPESAQPKVVIDAALGYMLDVKARLTEQIRLRVWAENSAKDAGAQARPKAGALIEPPIWGEGIVVVDYEALCPGGSVNLASFGFKPNLSLPGYHVAPAERPDGRVLAYGRVGARCSEYFIWVGSQARLPALHIRNASGFLEDILLVTAAMAEADRKALVAHL